MAKTIKEKDTDIINPFDKYVNYKTFLEAVGTKKVEDYCKDILTKEQIEWLLNDLKHYKNNKLTK